MYKRQQGPFELKQGGYGIAVRNPVYLKDQSGQEYFWGFTIVILRVPDIFSDAIRALSSFGYEYKLSKTDTPWSDTYKVVYQSDDQLNHPVSYIFTIGDETWKFEITPKNGWRNNTLLIIISGMFLTISLLLSVLTRVWLVAKDVYKRQGTKSNMISAKMHKHILFFLSFFPIRFSIFLFILSLFFIIHSCCSFPVSYTHLPKNNTTVSASLAASTASFSMASSCSLV